MSVQKIFTDEGNQQLIARLNDNNKCYILVGSDLMSEEIYYSGHIALDSDDLLELINELVYIREQMNNE